MKEIKLTDQEVAELVTNRARELEYAIRYERGGQDEMAKLIEAMEVLAERINKQK